MPQTAVNERKGGLQCESCGSFSLKVSDSRPHLFSKIEVVRRRRICLDCGGKSFTIEIPESKFSNLTEIIRRKEVSLLRMSVLRHLEEMQ